MQRWDDHHVIFVWEQIDVPRMFGEHVLIDKFLGLPASLDPIDLHAWTRDKVLPWMQAFRAEHGELSDFLTFAFQEEDGQVVGGPVLMPLPDFYDKHDYADALRVGMEIMGADAVVNCCEAAAAFYERSEIDEERMDYASGVKQVSQRTDAVDVLSVTIDTPLGYRGHWLVAVQANGSPFDEPRYNDNVTTPGGGGGRLAGLAGGIDPSVVGEA